MRGKNVVYLHGNLGKDPEVRHFEGGKCVATFPIATSEKYKNKDGDTIQNTEWHNVVIWNKLAEVAEKYLFKGSEITLWGKLTHRSWDKEDGTKGYITEVQVQSFNMVGKKGEGQGQSGPPAPEPTSAPELNLDSKDIDDLPF